ncbi:hypothetical protein [Priestia flexa]|uniref:hypothetical protein n=1 Tax=Priestia flexa TaxID=86664 RepID=UPI00077C1F32|nr:hypothetical protein [Priestia flexa]MED4590147.1 hypothetical protein [Priestia flexa]
MNINLHKLVNRLLILWIILYVFEGVLRYALGIFNLSFLIYGKNFIIYFIILIYLMSVLKSYRVNLVFFILVATILYGVFVGFVNGLMVNQILFATSTYTNLLAGFIIAYFFVDNINIFLRLFRIIVPITLIGLTLDYFFTLPWQGYTYDIAGINVEGNREWYAGGATNGIARLSGFQRSSSESAIILISLMTFHILNLLHRNIKQKDLLLYVFDICLFFAAIVGVIYTVSKSAYIFIFAMIIATMFLEVYKKVNQRDKLFVAILTKSFVILLFLYGIIPILLSLSGKVSIQSLSGVANLVFGSFLERVLVVWPQAFQLLGTNVNNILGRGIGGIGVAQKYFEPDLYNAADSLYVYIIVTFGIIGYSVIIYILLKILFMNLEKKYNSYLILVSIVIFSYGATVNIIETVGLSVVTGMLLGFYYKNKFEDKKNYEKFISGR